MSKQVIHSDKAPAAIGPYSQAVRTGNPVLLVSNEWALGWIRENNPDLQLGQVPFDRKEA